MQNFRDMNTMMKENRASSLVLLTEKTFNIEAVLFLFPFPSVFSKYRKESELEKRIYLKALINFFPYPFLSLLFFSYICIVFTPMLLYEVEVVGTDI